jgi:hypothetical protein
MKIMFGTGTGTFITGTGTFITGTGTLYSCTVFGAASGYRQKIGPAQAIELKVPVFREYCGSGMILSPIQGGQIFKIALIFSNEQKISLTSALTCVANI